MVKLQKSYVFIIFSEIGRRTAFPYVDMDTKKVLLYQKLFRDVTFIY